MVCNADFQHLSYSQPCHGSSSKTPHQLALKSARRSAGISADVRVPGMLEACVVRSPYAHAKILGIDSSAAYAIKGVVAVVSASDLPSDLQPIPMRLTPAPELAHTL